MEPHRRKCMTCARRAKPASVDDFVQRLVGCDMCRQDIALGGAYTGTGLRLRVAAERRFGNESVADAIQKANRLAVEESRTVAAAVPDSGKPELEPEPAPEQLADEMPEVEHDESSVSWITWTSIAHASADGAVTLCGLDIPSKAVPAGDDKRRCKNCEAALA